MGIPWIRVPRSTRARWFCRASLLLLGVVFPSQTALAADPPDTLTDVEVDLSGRLFKQVLPFDTTFLINGQVPATTQRVTVQYIGKPFNFRVVPPKPEDCSTPPPEREAPPPQCFEQTRNGEREISCAWEPASGPILWERQEAPPPDVTSPLTFRVAIPPLEAKHHYVFNFEVQRALTEDDLKDFRARARNVLESALWANRNDDFTAADNESLRRQLVRELQIAACPGLRIASDNLFNLSIPYARLPDDSKIDFNRLTREVLDPQGRIRDNVRERATNQMSFSQELKSIAENQALDKLIQGLRERAASGQQGANALLKEFLDQNQNALRFAGLGDEERSVVALGIPANAPARPPFVETMPSDVAGQFAASYSASERDLRALEGWLRSLVQGSNRPLLDEAVSSQALTQADVTSLEALLTDVEEAANLAFALANNAEQVQTNQARRAASLESLVEEVEIQAREAGVLLQSNTLGSFRTQQSWYIAGDFGFLYGPELDKSVPYLGTNIYFRPVNKAVPLSEKGGWGRRFAVTLGLTVKSIADDNPKTRDDLFDNNSLLLGAGLRLTDSARLGAGALIFEELNPNPLLGGESVTYSPYVSLSFDIDVLSFFRGFAAILGNPAP